MTARKADRARVPTPAPLPRRPRWWIVLELAAFVAVLAIASNLLFERLGESSFHDGDEALYATVAREMAESHSYLTPTYWETPFLHKPPLPYWLMAISGAVLPGSREFAARFPSALSALLLLGLVYASTRRLAGAMAALFATCVLAVNHQFLFEHAARSASFDALLALLMFGALVAGLDVGGGPMRRFIAVVLLGWVALVKAPMVIFPAAVILAHYWTRDRRFPRALALRGLAGVAVVALPWHVYQLIAHGSQFWDTYVMYEIVGRVGDTVRDETAYPLIHLGAAWWSFLPWSPLVAAALVAGVVGWPWRAGDARDGVVRSMGIYAASILVFFCFIPSKWPWYAIPAYPALAVVTAVFVRRWYDASARRALPVVLAALASACIFFLGTHPEYEPAARPSFQWPAHEAFYVWGAGREGAFAVVAALATVAAATVCLSLRRKRIPGLEVATIAAALLLMLHFNLRSVRAVPQTHASAASRLAAKIEADGFGRVYTVGFPHLERYGGRQAPLSAYYLLGIRNAEVIDCGDDLACMADVGDARAAVVVWGPGLSGAGLEEVSARVSALVPRLEAWVIQSPRRFEKLTGP